MKAATAAQVKAWRKLKTRPERQVQGLFLVEGEHMVGEALAAGRVQRVLGCDARAVSCFPGLRPSQRAYRRAALSRWWTAARRRAWRRWSRCPWPRTLEQLGIGWWRWTAADPGNVGTILRTMDAAGYRPADRYAHGGLRKGAVGLHGQHIPRRA